MTVIPDDCYDCFDYRNQFDDDGNDSNDDGGDDDSTDKFSQRCC